jgi:cobalt-zinc-cadmium efflux system outer membrane protein
MNRSLLFLFIVTIPLAPWLGAQTSAAPSATELTFSAFMREVEASNLDYATQRYNVSIAQAQLAAARLFLPNPQLQFGYSADITPGRSSGQRESTITSGGFMQTIPLWGKRGDRIEIARHNLLAASATLDDFWRNLRSTAASAFIEARVKQSIAERMRQSSESFDQVAAMTAQRLKVGDVGDVDATQARVDALQFHSQYLSAQSDAENAVIALSQLAGKAWANTTIQPKATLVIPIKDYDLGELMATALAKRPDVLAARETRDASSSSVRLAKANRIPDIGVGLTYTQTGASSNTVAPYEKEDALGAALSFELPVFTTYRHELEVARYSERQADKQLDAALLKAQIDVRQAFATYRAAVGQIAQYRGRGALTDAEAVLKARTFSYEHGDSSLLDVLLAQRDLNDVYLNYFNALGAYAAARVGLEQAAGIWEVDF